MFAVHKQHDYDLNKHTHAHPQKLPAASLDEIFQKIRTVVYKNGIRTTEFFRDHDKLRSGVITENQVFVKAWVQYVAKTYN